MLSLTTQVMASHTHSEQGHARMQVDALDRVMPLQVQRVIQRNDRVKIKCLVTTKRNEFSSQQEVLSQQPHERVQLRGQ